jgi:hypothetical protein
MVNPGELSTGDTPNRIVGKILGKGGGKGKKYKHGKKYEEEEED